MTIECYMALPWTIEVERRNDDGEYFAAYITELEGFVATGRTAEELDEDLWTGLADFLRSFVEHGEDIPVPRGVRRPAETPPVTSLDAAGQDAFAGLFSPNLQRLSNEPVAV